jgi:hypothetical protein
LPDGNGLIVVEQLPDTGAIVIHEVTGRGRVPALNCTFVRQRSLQATPLRQ